MRNDAACILPPASLAKCHSWNQMRMPELYVLRQVSGYVFIWINICLPSEMLSYDVGIVPVGVLDLGWLETRGVSIWRHQCASAPRTSGTCRLFLMAVLSLGREKKTMKKDNSTSDAWRHYYQSFRIIIIHFYDFDTQAFFPWVNVTKIYGCSWCI